MASRRERAQERKERLEKERVEKERKRRTRMTIGALAAVLIIAGIVAYVAIFDQGDDGYAPTDSMGMQVTADQVLIPVSNIGATAKFGTVDIDGTAVRLFGVKGTDGQVHIAADACDVCYAEHKGYHQSGDSMQCNNCGKTFKINSIGTENTAGGCWPSYVHMEIDGDNVVIQKSDLEMKEFMFG